MKFQVSTVIQNVGIQHLKLLIISLLQILNGEEHHLFQYFSFAFIGFVSLQL